MCSTRWATVDGVAFLASWLRLPANVLELFLETWTVTRCGQVALSVMGFGFANTLVPLVYFGKLRGRPLDADPWGTPWRQTVWRLGRVYGLRAEVAYPDDL
jgi:hypothetical protein